MARALHTLNKVLLSGDTLVVWRLDRLGCGLPNLVQVVAELERSEIGFESLTEKIETNSASGKLIFHVVAALAEFERSLIRDMWRVPHDALQARRGDQAPGKSKRIKTGTNV